MSESADVPAE